MDRSFPLPHPCPLQNVNFKKDNLIAILKLLIANDLQPTAGPPELAFRRQRCDKI